MISAQSIQSRLYQLIADLPIPARDNSTEIYITTWRQNRARKEALRLMSKRYPHYTDSLFDDYFLRHAGAQTVEHYLTGRLDRHTAAHQLAIDWYEQMEKPLPVSRKHVLADVTMAADTLLGYLRDERISS
jgi:hypothetical protein